MTILTILDSFTTELLEIKTLQQLEVFKQKVEKETELRNGKYPKYTCECGSIVNKKGKGDHNKTIKHKQFLDKVGLVKRNKRKEEVQNAIKKSIKRVMPTVDKITFAPDMFT